jgi:adhesin transport system outer membrane protein
MTLGEAIRRAIADNAAIGISEGRVGEALAGIDLSRSALLPQVDVSAGGGYGATGDYEDGNGAYFTRDTTPAAARGEVALTGRQLLFDFGAAAADVARARSVHDGESLRRHDQTEEVALKVSEAYLKILEQRELVAIAGDYVGELSRVLALLSENAAAGNAAVADIKRVRARLIDAEAVRADAEAELETASDRFRRLVRVTPGRLADLPSFSRSVPASPAAALAVMRVDNPRVRAAEATLRSVRQELRFQEASGLPKIQLETDLTGRHYWDGGNRTEMDARVMVALRYKILDGGLQASQSQQVRGKLLQAEMRLREEAEEAEDDLRQFYRILATARRKAGHLREGAADARKAMELYDEQFQGGKRSLLELLEVQTASFQARLAELTNRFQEKRAVYGILRTLGGLTQAALDRRR